MSIDDFRTVLDHLPNLLYWSPHGYNEPLCHPEFFDFIEETDKRGIATYLVTNGTKFHPYVAEKLASYRVFKVIFSIDAVGSRYEQIRRGAKWDTVETNLAYATYQKYPVVIHATIWDENIDQIPRLVELSRKWKVNLGINDICWKNEYGKSTKTHSIRENLNESAIGVAVAPYLNDPHISIQLGKPTKRSCNLPWSSIYVDVIGNGYPCTDNLDYLVGNFFVNPVSEIYQNALYERFRKISLSGEKENCRNCLAWGKK
jgi:radical SAM protein with 4Fe4S-binding SPASM domain